MATSKNLERVCAIVLIVSLLASAGLVYVKANGGESTGQTMGYESRLFDTSRVHTIDIVMDGWDSFIENCESEEYSACTVVIDGESYKNVAIRSKGNTSLSSVRSLGSSRYSFKVEFDHYDDTKTYHGLDKLNLNNLIFDNAKTDISEADEQRLIASLKKLSADENLEDVLDTDEVLRYFVVHNFVVNGDSYTGSMIHNYYLYEQDGKLAMIPWDYNLAFGTFQSNDADSAVNDDIDAVLSDRPMQAWIFSDEAYTAEYHALFAEFLETVDWGAIIDEAYTLIAPYVEQDPTKFCTAEEFETGAAALRTFCQLRSEAVAAQLAGEEMAVDASGLTLSDMGTMNNGGGRGFDRGNTDDTDGQTPPERPDDSSGFTRPDGMDGSFRPPDGTAQSFSPPGGGSSDTPAQDSAGGTSGWIWLGISAAVLLAAVMVAVGFRKRR